MLHRGDEIRLALLSVMLVALAIPRVDVMQSRANPLNFLSRLRLGDVVRISYFCAGVANVPSIFRRGRPSAAFAAQQTPCSARGVEC
jgi:hypothetical protein